MLSYLEVIRRQHPQIWRLLAGIFPIYIWSNLIILSARGRATSEGEDIMTERWRSALVIPWKLKASVSKKPWSVPHPSLNCGLRVEEFLVAHRSGVCFQDLLRFCPIEPVMTQPTPISTSLQILELERSLKPKWFGRSEREDAGLLSWGSFQWV